MKILAGIFFFFFANNSSTQRKEILTTKIDFTHNFFCLVAVHENKKASRNIKLFHTFSRSWKETRKKNHKRYKNTEIINFGLWWCHKKIIWWQKRERNEMRKDLGTFQCQLGVDLICKHSEKKEKKILLICSCSTQVPTVDSSINYFWIFKALFAFFSSDEHRHDFVIEKSFPLDLLKNNEITLENVMKVVW